MQIQKMVKTSTRRQRFKGGTKCVCIRGTPLPKQYTQVGLVLLVLVVVVLLAVVPRWAPTF